MKHFNTLLTCFFTPLLTLMGVSVSAAEVGNPAPDFELPGSDGQTHRLADYRGRHVVLAFFPKAFTGG